MHKLNPESFFRTNGDGKVELCVTSSWRDLSQMVYKEDADGGIYCRNLYSNNFYGGYLVHFPGEKEAYGYDDWLESERLSIVPGKVTKQDMAFLSERLGKFRYTLIKWSEKRTVYRADVMHAYTIWKEHPEIEFLLALGFEKLAFSPSFYRLTGSRKKAALNILKNEMHNISMRELNTRVKYGISGKEYAEYSNLKDIVYKDFQFSYPEYLYIKKTTHLDGDVLTFCSFYDDYKKMIKELGKFADDYWHFPKDLARMHKKAVSELNALHVYQKKKDLAKRQAAYSKAVSDFTDLSKKFGAYEIAVPELLDDWIVQADVLHQCIITAKYDEQVAQNKCVIVFIRKNGIPIATAQVYKNGRIGQFYADEKTRDIYPSEEVKQAFNQWHELFMERVHQLEGKRNMKETA